MQVANIDLIVSRVLCVPGMATLWSRCGNAESLIRMRPTPEGMHLLHV